MIKCAGSYKETTALGKPELQSYIVLTLVGYSPNRDWDLQICAERECSFPCVPRIRIYFPEFWLIWRLVTVVYKPTWA